MNETEIEVVARAAYEKGTSRSDWGNEAEGPKASQWDHWRGIAHAAMAALERHRQERTDMQHAQQARMMSELSDLAHNSQGG